MRFSDDFLDELRSRLPVSGVAGRRVQLKRAGREWRGLSPFQQERTPSFYVNDAKQMWFDFASGKNGNIFDFVMQTEGLSFPDAVRVLAAQAGMMPEAEDAAPRPMIAPATPTPKPPDPDHRELARLLWAKSRSLTGTPAETYLRSRQCFVASDHLRFLPGRSEHPPAMISRFGVADLTGVHLTRLRPDGSGKAGTQTDKIMLGPSMGQPIIVYDQPDRDDLYVAEGIEDAATLALVTGCSAWAAGASGRIGPVVGSATSYARVIVAIDNDAAGRRALAAAREARPDVIPLQVSKVLGCRVKLDANRVMIERGADALLAAIEWSLAQVAYRRGEIGFQQMCRESERAQGIFQRIVDSED